MIELSITTKTYLVLGVMVTCFIVLYPKIFHPMVLNILGMNQHQNNFEDSMMHPRERVMRSGQRDTVPQFNRPHPGMRGMEGKKAAPAPGKGGGIMTMILPVYAICIVLYLIYTLAKIFNGNNKDKSGLKKDILMSQHFDSMDFSSASGEGVEEEVAPDDEEETVEQWTTSGRRPNGARKSRSAYTSSALRARTLPRDLERLLKKVDDKNISENEMQELKQRLLETERQMSQLLAAMKFSADPAPVPATEEEEEEECLEEESIEVARPSPSAQSHIQSHNHVKAVPTEDEDEEVVTASEGEEIEDSNKNKESSRKVDLSEEETETEEEEEDIETCGTVLRERGRKEVVASS